MPTMRRQPMWSGLLLLLTLSLAGCGGAGSAAATRSTPTPTATATLAPTPTASPRPPGTTFTCPTTVSPDGTTKTFSDPQFGLSFSYPATWTENDCQQVSANAILIGNLFFVDVTPRQGRTIAQWVTATKTPEETVTLTPLVDPHAVEAVRATVTWNGPGPMPLEPPPPFFQTEAIVAGTDTFYSVGTLIAQMSMTDTIPHLSTVELAQQIVSTFDVP